MTSFRFSEKILCFRVRALVRVRVRIKVKFRVEVRVRVSGSNFFNTFSVKRSFGQVY